jgi:hypothetical protein
MDRDGKWVRADMDRNSLVLGFLMGFVNEKPVLFERAKETVVLARPRERGNNYLKLLLSMDRDTK